jgi:hypothetical protein
MDEEENESTEKLERDLSSLEKIMAIVRASKNLKDCGAQKCTEITSDEIEEAWQWFNYALQDYFGAE